MDLVEPSIGLQVVRLEAEALQRAEIAKHSLIRTTTRRSWPNFETVGAE